MDKTCVSLMVGAFYVSIAAGVFIFLSVYKPKR